MTIEKVFNVFVSVFDVDVNVDRGTLIYNEFKGWDSVAHMTLIAALEDEFDEMLETDDILDMSSFDKAVEIMGKYSAQS
ncbi:MAG: acyl carrier protein [Aliivibrio sp.]|uniref:acyl carrier protein n=1 Tax=Aliivibrio sp. TaxID=1872443 RepID=UPI001A5F8C16|nr:acyl carrier protein [Aliivibrio sp.]